MFSRNNKDVKNRLDVNHYTARRLGDMAESLNQLAKAFDDEIEKNGQLSRVTQQGNDRTINAVNHTCLCHFTYLLNRI